MTGSQDTTRLEVVAEGQPPRRPDLSQQILQLLASGQSYSRAKLRETLAVKNERLGEALQTLEQAGQIGRTSAGWQSLD